MKNETLNGSAIIAQFDSRNNPGARIILIEKVTPSGQPDEYVTAFHSRGCSEWALGNYFPAENLGHAVADLIRRAKAEGVPVA